MNRFINFKEIFRSFKRNLASGILSILGLTIGITITLLIGFWSLNEFSYDKFHSNYENKYRLCRKGFLNNESVLLGSDCVPAGKEASEKFPEIESFLRVVPTGRQVVNVDDEKYFVEDITVTDPNFFSYFSFRLLTGNPVECLNSPNNVVINEKLAKNWFRDKNPIGQIIEIWGKKLTVSAIAENSPSNSHLSFQMIVPIQGIDWIINDKWGERDNVMTYFELKPGSDINKLAGNISKLALEACPMYKQFKIEHFLQRIDDIHFSTGFRFDKARVMDKRILFIFITIASLILLIACFNFINLFISTSFLRSKSIGIRKIVGSSKSQFYISSFAETSIYVIATTLIAIGLSYVLLPWFNQITGTSIAFNFTDPRIYFLIGALLLATILVAGIIPMMYITRQNPEAIIRYKFKGKNTSVLQRILVIAQFTASIILISSSLVIKKQIQFIRTKDLGFNKENMIYLTPRGKFSSDYEMVRQELMKMPGITDVTSKSCLPSDWNNGNPVTSENNPDSKWIMEICDIKANYPTVMGNELAKGEIPWDASANESLDCMINETAVKALGFNDPIGKQIGLYQRKQKYTIRGILKDTNTKSLHRVVDPQVFIKLNQLLEYHVMLIKASDPQLAIHSIQTLWTKLNPEHPFEYHFLDQVYENLYKVESTANQVVTIGMVIAIFLAFMGLFAIAHYTSLRRIKEVGVRKVNGAKTGEIVALLNRDFLVWVIVAFVVATPVSWYVMMKWLDNFAFKTDLNWWIFSLAGLLSLGIALITVSWQSWKAATRNPVKSLRYE
jgi:putative ABC transport system permease protein